ncbi:RecX family transcriptional regulator [Candidatus Saccharibacteria bacterium]|nr:RecX family transcriptional regulator [Candidatus Saccharibacteria bacterium]
MEKSKYVITNLKQGVKNPNRVNVFVNSKYALSLDVAQVVDLNIKVGLEISEEELTELKKASEYGKLYQRTLEWVLMRPRSVRETRDYLSKKLKTSSSDSLLRARRYGAQSLVPLPVGRVQSSEDVSELSDSIIQRLLDKGYIDDYKFAEYYVENRFVKKGISKKRLKMELIKKGVAREIIDEVIDGRDDEEEIRKMIAKKRAKYDDEKLMGYLMRQGFSYDLVRRILFEEQN